MGWFDDFLKSADDLRKQKNPFYDEGFIRDANKNIESIFGGGNPINNLAMRGGYEVAKGMNHRSADVKRPTGRGYGGQDLNFTKNFTNGAGVENLPMQQTDPMEELWNLLNEKYNTSPVDTSFLDTALNSQIGAVNDARNQAQQHFTESDANLKGMHDAFRNDILAQAPKIQEQNQQYQQDLTGIFDKTLQENAQRAATNKAADAEMFSRLGIAPAANQPDVVGQAIEQGNQRAVGSRDARLAESATIGNSELERNTSAANAVGAAGVQRRSDLNMRLQDILGQLGSKEADIRGNYSQAQGQAAQEQEQRQYERFLNDRDWNMNRYNQEMDYRLKQADAQKNNTLSGFNGLQATTNPEVQQAVVDIVSTEPNLDIKNPNQVMIALRKKYPHINPDEAFAWLSQYNNLGSTNKFPVG